MWFMRIFFGRPQAWLVLSLLAGCGGMPERPAPVVSPGTEHHSTGMHPIPEPAEGTLKEPIKAALYAQYREWQGTPYRYGGTSKRGVDCSGFVYITFRQEFGKTLPRTTAAQSRLGYSVSRDALRAGDLVFFHTGSRTRHVGIYIEDGYFLHASSSNGVMLSSLSDPYWSSHYWKTQRLTVLLAGR